MEVATHQRKQDNCIVAISRRKNTKLTSDVGIAYIKETTDIYMQDNWMVEWSTIVQHCKYVLTPMVWGKAVHFQGNVGVTNSHMK